MGSKSDMKLVKIEAYSLNSTYRIPGSSHCFVVTEDRKTCWKNKGGGWDDSRERVVDDKTNVIALVHRDKRYGTLSQVLVRDRWSGQVETVWNAGFYSAGGRARRVITMPTRSSYKAMRYSGQFQLDKSASELERLEVTVGEVFCAWPGDLVTVQRTGWVWNGRYRAVQVTAGMDGKGYWSRLELAPPDFTV